jgi:cell division protein FtsI (penicillin-binding protein 3)
MIPLSPTRRQRLQTLAKVGAGLLFCLLVAQFFRLQVLEHQRWKKRAEAQHYFVVKEPFRRGTFYANTSIQPLHQDRPVAFAIDVPLSHLYADPKEIPPSLRKEACESILRLLSPSVKEATKLSVELKRKCRCRRLVSWVTEEQKGLFLEWWRPFAKNHRLPANALFFVSDFKRFHPMGRLLGQVLHTIQDRRDEVTGKASPTGGLELALNTVLEGSVGHRRLMRSPHNSLETGEVLTQPTHGADVELSINHCLQAIVEEELQRGVERHRAKGGVAVMINPKSGEILALAQYPFFSPDQYQDYFNNKALAEHAKIKAISDAHEPGSPMKALTISIAMRANRLLKEQGKQPCFHLLEKFSTGVGNFPGRSKPITDVHFHKFLNFYMAVQKSSNIYMASLTGRVVHAMGDGWYRQQLETGFGLGQKTGVELVGESVGILPQPGKILPGGKLEWSKATPYSLAMGYNVQVTALQFARAMCVIANRGILPELTLVRKIFRTTENGTEILVDNTKPERQSRFPRVFDEQDMGEVVRALKFVTKTGGTAAKADIYGYTEAGKTGTTMKLVNGQYSASSHFASFVGFTPATNPSIVLFVGIDDPWVGYVPGLGTNHQGGTCAAPIFREIGRRTLEFLGVPMDDPYGFPARDPRGDPKRADWYAETEWLNQLHQQWNG